MHTEQLFSFRWRFDGGFLAPRERVPREFTAAKRVAHPQGDGSWRQGDVGGRVLLATVLLVAAAATYTRFGVGVNSNGAFEGSAVSRAMLVIRCRISNYASALSRRHFRRAVVLRVNGGYSGFCDCAGCINSSMFTTSVTGGTSRRAVVRRTGRFKGDGLGRRACGECPMNGIAALSRVTKSVGELQYRRPRRYPR